MAAENTSQVKEMIPDEHCCFDDVKPTEIIEETSVETTPLMVEETQGDDDVLLPPPAAVSNGNVNLRRYSTGALDKRVSSGNAEVLTRFRGNQTSSTHDLCKHGKRREEDLVIKPWKLVKKKNVEGRGDLVKAGTLSVMRKSLGTVSKPDKSLPVAKRDAAATSEVVKSCDGSPAKRSETKSSISPSDSSGVRMAKKTNVDAKKVSRISESKSSKEDLLRNLKNKEKKTEIDEPVRCDDVLEKKPSRISENKSSKEDLLKSPKKKEKTEIDEPVRCDDVLETKPSRISENKSSKEELLKSPKNREKTEIDEPVRCDDVLEKKPSRISENKSSKEDILKSPKNREKTEIGDPVRCDDFSGKTLYVVESSIEEKKMKKKSIKSVKSEIQQSSEKKTLRGIGKKSLTLLPSLSPSSVEVKESRVTKSDPRPIRQVTSRSKTGLSEKKESSSATLVTNSKAESKIRPKRIVLKVTPPPGPPTRPVSFKKGKVLEPKPEDSTPTSISFKKRVVQEPKLRSDGNKKKKILKDKREGVGKMSYTNGEGKREKVVLRHRKVEAKKKLQTLFNNVIEETVNKLEEVRKSKVKALVGAFETVISLQDNGKTSQTKKVQSKSTSSQVVEG